MKKITTLLLGSLCLLSLNSCFESTTGNGVRATESRTVSLFDKVKSDGSFKVYITNGEVRNVVVSADENLLQYIETYVSGETLHIDIEELHSVKAVVPMEVFITTPELDGIAQSGSGSVIADYYEADHFDLILSGSGRIDAEFEANSGDVRISGSGRIELSGAAHHVDMAISGSGNIEGEDFFVTNCETYTSGSGDMWINVENELESHISGSGNVYYYGNPSVSRSISGSGNVIHKH